MQGQRALQDGLPHVADFDKTEDMADRVKAKLDNSGRK